MRARIVEPRSRRALGWALLLSLAAAAPLRAQNRGVYPLGMSAFASGALPDNGFTYANQLLFYSRSHAKDANGTTTATGNNAVVMDMNTFSWVSSRRLPFGGRYSAVATIPVARNQLTSDVVGPISGGGGLADTFYIPLIVGWTQKRAAIKALFGVLAPTGAFTPGGSENVGSGYWTSTPASGQTFFLTTNRRLALNTFEMYEFHTTQTGTSVKPGDTFDFDYSLMQTLSPDQSRWRVQVGLVGYEQRQTTARTGPSITPAQSAERYQVNGVGAAVNLGLPGGRVSVGARYFDEFANRSTYQGYSMQFAGAIAF